MVHGPDHVAWVLEHAMRLCVVLMAPPVIAAAVAGVLVALLQTLTQLQEQTLGFAARALAVLVTLAACGPWMASEIARFGASVWLMAAPP